MRRTAERKFSGNVTTYERYSDDVVVALPTEPAALYNSAEDQHLARCYDGTRTCILHELTAWGIGGEDETCAIFWIHGPAGTGKSTISRTICHSFADLELLGASYFFRKQTSRTKTTRLFPTIANRFMTTVPGFARYLKECLGTVSSAEIEKKALEEQFDTLLFTPLSMLPKPAQPSMLLTRVIVVDALDECDNHEDISFICKLLSRLRLVEALRLRVLFTSRSASTIMDTFDDLTGEQIEYRILAMQNAFKDETEKDMAMFLRAKFREIRKKRQVIQDPWPVPEDMDDLIKLATTPSPLFIYASTLCRFVDDGTGRRNPVKQLQIWLKQRNSPSQFEQIYQPVMRQILLGTEKDNGEDDDKEGKKEKPLDDEDRSQLMQILGSILLLSAPLSASSLAALLNMEQYTLDHWLRNLHAVLNVPEDSDAPVEILHNSFSDFLLAEQGGQIPGFRIDLVGTHRLLASHCFRLMRAKLRMDIAEIGHTEPVNWTTDTFSERHFTVELGYACFFWVHHVIQSYQKGIDSEEIESFLKDHLLHWLEAMSVTNQLSGVPTSIERLLRHAMQANSCAGSLVSLLKDIKRFVVAHGSIMTQAPLQVYGTALVFTPQQSLVKRHCWKQRLEFITTANGGDENWGMCLQSLVDPEFDHSASRHMSFSPAGDKLAACWGRHGIKIWDTTTFSVQVSISAQWSGVFGIVFSPNGKQIATGSAISEVQLWDAASGALRQTLRDDEDGYIVPFCFLSDNVTIAVGSKNKVWLWDTATGSRTGILDGHDTNVTALIFSDDGKSMVSASSDDTLVRLWSTETGLLQKSYEGLAKSAYGLAFGPAGTILAVSPDCQVWQWNMTTGSSRHAQFEGRWRESNIVALSQNGKVLASSATAEDPWESVVHVWDNQGTWKTTLVGHEFQIENLVFSPDGETLASSSLDGTIRLWDVSEQSCRDLALSDGTTESHSSTVRAIAFSPDGKTVASSSSDRTIRLWSSEGVCQRVLEGHEDAVLDVAFSPDGLTLASGSEDTTVRLWDPSTRANLKTLDGRFGHVERVAFTLNGESVVSKSNDGQLAIHNVETGAVEDVWRVAPTNVHATAFSPDGKKIASGTYYHLHLWDAVTGQSDTFSSELPDDPHVIAFSSDSRLVAFACLYSLFLWNLPAGVCRQLQECTEYIDSIAFSPEGTALATATLKSVTIWDPETLAALRTFEGCKGPIGFPPDGNILITGQEDGLAGIWDPSTGIKQRNIITGSLSGVAFSLDGKIMATGSADGSVRLWNRTADFTLLATLAGHTGICTTLAFSPDASTLASSSKFGSLKLWDVASATQRHILLKRHGSQAIAFSTDGQTILSSSGRETYRWNVKTGALVQRLEGDQCLDHSAFSKDGRYVKIDKTPVDHCSELSHTCPHQTCSGNMLRVDEDWVVREGKKLLWLPPDYRPTCMASHGDTLVLGHESGRLTFLRFLFS
ncbi:hypothetical protein ASPBRDRAFT_424327 [Aspergillus brasiliensis CBS 101740]|uniref:Mitochondrial division protein 1 n=1 Tax=Aspergillus brasiliensis (strain CBS 101740 / IMI 381727 / IBT 21946) TaxID=767769 RepID=A0A1L9U3N6_ASPBC|nr:hypothetical protein ASPBRDRAFT_424327 [Aspergillus brasiliensis CBS 101740]